MSQRNNDKKKKNKKNKNPKGFIGPKRKFRRNHNTGDFGAQMASVVQQGLGKTLSMYPTTKAFGRVYMNPWSKEEARLPFLPIYSTKCVRTTVNGSGILNSGGVGFVTCIPMNGITNDMPSVFWSNNAASPPTFETDYGTYSIGHAAAAKTNFTSQSFLKTSPSSASVRCVAYGLRIRYKGTALNSAGEWYACQTTPKFSLNAYSVDDVQKVQGYKTHTFANRGWNGYTRMLTSRVDAEYVQTQSGSFFQNQTYNWCVPAFQVSSEENTNYLGVIFTGTAGEPFEYEVVGHYEIIGPNLDTEAVKPADEAAAQMIVNQGHKLRHQDTRTRDHLMDDNSGGGFVNFLKSAAKEAIPVIGDMLGVGSLSKKLANLI